MLQTIYYIKTPIVNSTNMFISTKTPRNPFPDSASTFPATQDVKDSSYNSQTLKEHAGALTHIEDIADQVPLPASKKTHCLQYTTSSSMKKSSTLNSKHCK